MRKVNVMTGPYPGTLLYALRFDYFGVQTLNTVTTLCVTPYRALRDLALLKRDRIRQIDEHQRYYSTER